MRPTTLISALAVAAVLAGCGGSGSTSSSQDTTSTDDASATPSTDTSAPAVTTGGATTAKSTSTPAAGKVPKDDMVLTSSVALDPLPARFTCDGANVSLPLKWNKVPPRTAEIDVFVFQEEGTVPVWAVAGLKPSVHELVAGQLPTGATQGRNGSAQNRYSVCPAKGSQATYIVRVFPLPRRISVKPGFNPEALFNRALGVATSSGEITFSYQRS